MHRAVRSSRQAQLTQPVLQPALQGGLLFGLGICHEESAGHADLHRIKAAPGCLDCFLEHCDSVPNLLRRGVLAEQQIIAFLSHLAD